MPRRGQLAVKLDIAGVLGQEPCQRALVMPRQQGGQSPRCRRRFHDFRRVGMQHGDRQVRCQQPALAVEDLAAFGLWWRHDAGGAGVRLVGGEEHHPRRDRRENGHHHHGGYHQPHLGDAPRARRVGARRQHKIAKA